MWLDIYPKFDTYNINGIYFEREEIITAFNKFDITKRGYVEFGYNDRLDISLSSVIGHIKEIKISDTGMIGDFYLHNNNFYNITDDMLKHYVLSTSKTGHVNDNKGVIISIEKLNLIHINEAINKFQKRKKIVNKLLSDNIYNIKKDL